MKRSLCSALVAAALLSGGAVAADARLQPGAEVAIEGKSSVRDFTCKAKSFNAKVELAGADPALTLENLAGAVKEVKLDIPAAALDCANDTMNEHMREAIHAEKHQNIGVQIHKYEVGVPVDGVAPMKLYADITLAGVTRPVTIIANARMVDGAVKVDGRYAMRMTEWGVKPPSLMLGTMKVRESVVIRFAVAVKP